MHRHAFAFGQVQLLKVDGGGLGGLVNVQHRALSHQTGLAVHHNAHGRSGIRQNTHHAQDARRERLEAPSGGSMQPVGCGGCALTRCGVNGAGATRGAGGLGSNG
ncbi:hypothetical protein [Limnohabitans sp. T6-20]|uniref:hypothetical protein n=1 Tax=Limnohabitans sp. T6-20 TaxID=1100725 RepID=UPI000D3D2106|nr:hypothetical protein [Limnohabitans sp. T6-20]PUE10140.1 hypothetical protein B9Z33_08485 [Limnohabitans sp. T6-20]